MLVSIHLLLYALFHIIDHKKNERILQLNDYKKLDSCKVLFMGDSHTARGIDFSKIPGSYSLAYYGENNMMTFYKLKYVIDHNYKLPQYIVLPCDIVTHTYGFNLARNNKAFYYSLMDSKEAGNLGDNAALAYLDYYKMKLFPYLDWQYALNQVNMDRQKKAGIKFSDLSPEKQKKAAAFLIQDELLENRNKDSWYNKRALTFIERTIQLCKEHNIKLIFLKFPLTKSIFDELKNNVDSNYITNRPAEDIVRKNNIPILDFEYIYVNNPELFFDTHHLNRMGKIKFSDALSLKIDSLLKVY